MDYNVAETIKCFQAGKNYEYYRNKVVMYLSDILDILIRSHVPGSGSDSGPEYDEAMRGLQMDLSKLSNAVSTARSCIPPDYYAKISDKLNKVGEYVNSKRFGDAWHIAKWEM